VASSPGLDRIAASAAARDTLLAMRGSSIPAPLLTNDLRLRVLAKEEISAEEMLLIVNDIRQGRRSAARTEGPPTTRRTKARPGPLEDLRSLLDQDL
jgi:hypothetical protein